MTTDTGGGQTIRLDLGGEPAAQDDGVPVLREEGTDEATLPAHAMLNSDGSVTLPLRFPVTLTFRKASTGDTQEEEFSEFKMQRLNGADMMAITQAPAARVILVAIGRSAHISPARMDLLFVRMDGADIGAAGQVVSYFLGSGQRTGR